MKKIFLMAAAAMMAATSINAQARFDAGTFTLQPRLGGTGSQFVNAPDMNAGGKTIETAPTGGSFIGVDLEYYLSRRLGLAAGINYSEAGTGWEDYDYTGAGGVKMEVKETAWKTSYINVPVTINWYVLKGFALKTGLQFGFLTSADNYSRTEYSTGGVDYTLTAENGIKDDFNKFDVSLPIGLSYEFKVPIVLDLRYNIGLTNVNKNATANGKDYSNIQAVFTVGYKFKL